MNISLSRRHLFLVAPIAVFLLFLGVSRLPITLLNIHQVRWPLAHIIPYFLFANFALLVGFLVWNAGSFREAFSNVSSETWIFLILILLTAFFLRSQAPHTHRLFYDEDIYLNIGHSIKTGSKAIFCDFGFADHCIKGQLNKQPNGLPFILSLLSFVFGTSEATAMNFSVLLSTATAFLAFLGAYLYFDSEKIALISALLISLTPICIRWAPTLTANHYFLFFTSLSFVSMVLLLKFKDFKSLGLMFISAAFAAQFRPEGVLLLLISFAFLTLYRDEFSEKFTSSGSLRYYLLILLVVGGLLTPYLIQIQSFSSSAWGSSGDKFSLGHARDNFPTNAGFYFKNERFSVFFTVLAGIGAFFGLKDRRKKTFFLCFWFAAFFLIYLFFYAGGYDYGVDVRFSHNTYLPLVLLGGFGSYSLVKLVPISRDGLKYLAIAVVIIVSFVPLYEFSTALGPKAWDARFSHNFGLEQSEKIDDRCVVLSHVATMFIDQGQASAQTYLMRNPEVRKQILQTSNNCVYFYYGYWCNAEQFEEGICSWVQGKYDLELIANESKRDKKFMFYKLKL